MIPPFGSVTGYLPRGIHHATWEELVKALGFSDRRRELLEGLRLGAHELKKAGASVVFLDGSFATKKHNPSDIDGCYNIDEVDPSVLDPVFRDFKNDRKAMKDKYGAEFFPATWIADNLSGDPFLTFFQKDRNGRAKGIIALDLSTLP